MNKIISYKQFLVEKLNEADTFIPSTNKEGISKATKDTKKHILNSINMILQDNNLGNHILEAFADLVINPVTATARTIIEAPINTAYTTGKVMGNVAKGKGVLDGTKKLVNADMSIDTNIKMAKLTDLSPEAKKGLIALLLNEGQKSIQPLFDFLDNENLQIPINFSHLDAISANFEVGVDSYINDIKKDVESNTFDTGFPSMFSIAEYMKLNLDRSSVGVSNSVSLLMTYMQGKLPEKTNWGSIEAYVYAMILLSSLYGLFLAYGKQLLALGDKIYKNGGDDLGKWVYKQVGTIIPGFRDEIKALGDTISKLAETPVGLALSGVASIIVVGNQISKILDDDDKEYYQKIGVNSFIPIFKTLPVYNSLIEDSRLRVETYLSDLKNNQGKIDEIRNLIVQKGKTEVVERFKAKFIEDFPRLFSESLQKKLAAVQEVVNYDYPVIHKKVFKIDYGNIDESILKGASKLADNWTGISWFNRYKDPNESIQKIALDIEKTLDLESFTNKEDPYVSLLGSLVYLSIIDVCISMPELVLVQGTVSPVKIEKMVLPYKLIQIPEFRVPSLPLSLVRVKKSISLEESGELCGVYISMVNKKGELIKTKFADVTFGTGKSIIKKPENFSNRFLALLKSYYGVKLIVTGNADVTGIEGKEKGERGNIPLSGRRAQSIMSLVKDLNGSGEFIDVVKDVKIYGKGAEYSRAYTEYLDKGMGTGKLISKLAGKDKAKATQIKKELTNDRRVEIYISFNDQDYQSKSTDQGFIKEYCVMKPNMQEGKLFDWEDDTKTKIVIKEDMISNFAVTVRPADGSIPVDTDTKKKVIPKEGTAEVIPDNQSVNLYGYNDFLFERVMRDKLKRRW